MTIKKINLIDIPLYNLLLNKFANKKSLLFVFLLSIIFISTNSHYFFFSVNALNSTNKILDKSKSNSNIGSCNNNMSIQSKTSIDGKTMIKSKNTCSDHVSSGGVTPSDHHVLKGLIVSAEYAPKSGVIINSVFGNWSLSTKGDNKDFKSLFIVQPIYYNIFEKSAITSTSNLNQPLKSSVNTTSYNLSNFISNSVQQQNSDITYVGKIDVIQNIHSTNIKQLDETNIYKGKDVSISIMDNRILIINFDKQSNLSNIFKNIPLVGLILSQ